MIAVKTFAAALVLVLAAIAMGACGAGDGDGPAAAVTTRTSAPPVVAAAPRRLPPTLAANAADADRLVGEGAAGLDARLAKLKGHPVVVNVWASWCGPCRLEFPFFAAAVRRHAAEVAFVGIDIMDNRDAAGRFLREEPPGFPSVFDPDGAAARSLRGGGRGVPTTFFIGSDGREVFTKIGGYADAAQLEADIRRHALGRS